MTHIRTTIRAALAARITAGLSGGLVCAAGKSRATDRSIDSSVWLEVDGEQSQRRGNCLAPERVIVARVVVQVRAETDALAEDTADDLAELIEAAISTDPSLGGVVDDTIYRGCEMDHDGYGESLARVDMSFEILV